MAPEVSNLFNIYTLIYYKFDQSRSNFSSNPNDDYNGLSTFPVQLTADNVLRTPPGTTFLRTQTYNYALCLS